MQNETNITRALVIMGISGCGKTTIGKMLGKKYNFPFFDGDDYHSTENVAKMASGKPLDDQDRESWLASLSDLIFSVSSRNLVPVVACSALKRSYRERLCVSADEIIFIHLTGSKELIQERMERRSLETQHFMKAGMLDSQLEALECPEGEPFTFCYDVTLLPQELCEVIAEDLRNAYLVLR